MGSKSADVLQDDEPKIEGICDTAYQSNKLIAPIRKSDSIENFQGLPKCDLLGQQNETTGAISPRKVSSQNETSKLVLPSSENDANMNKILQIFKSASQNYREYDIPLPLTTHVRDIYVELLEKNRTLLNMSMKDLSISPKVISSIDSLLDDLRKFCNHLGPKLEEVSASKNETALYQAKYAENISTKFIFIAEFLHHMKSYEKHIIIIVRQGELADIVEAVFKMQGYVYRRADLPETDVDGSEKNKMMITLMPVTGEIFEVEPAAILIDFDSSSSQLLHHTDIIHSLTTVFHLVIYNSVEHIEKVLGSSTDQLTDKFNLFKLIGSIAGDVGTLPNEYLGPTDAAKMVAQYVLQETQESWPLLPLPKLHEILEKAQILQTCSLLSIPNEYSKENSNIALKSPILVKRLSDDNCIETSDSRKRQRTEVFPNYSSPETQISPCKKIPIENRSKLIRKQDCEAEDYVSYDTSYDLNLSANETGPQVCLSLQQKLNSLEIKLCKKEETELELRKINQALELRCLDIESSLKIIQPRYLEALDDCGLFEREKKLAVFRESKMRQDLEKKEKVFAKAQQENARITEELKTAQEALLNSNIRDVVEFEKMRLKISTLKADNQRLLQQKKIKQSEYDYMQTNYQAISTSAASLTHQIQTQKIEIEALKLKASENAVKIQHMQRNNEISELQALIKGLRAEKSDLERHVDKLNEHFSARISGRPNTRSNSTPRSPRSGACVSSPRTINRVFGNCSLPSTTSGNQSQDNSPASGDLGSGTRVAATNYEEGTHRNMPHQGEKLNLKRFGNHYK